MTRPTNALKPSNKIKLQVFESKRPLSVLQQKFVEE